MNTNNIELEDRIHAAQVRSAYSNTAPGMSATAVAAFLVAGILWPAFSLLLTPEASQSYHLYFGG